MANSWSAPRLLDLSTMSFSSISACCCPFFSVIAHSNTWCTPPLFFVTSTRMCVGGGRQGRGTPSDSYRSSGYPRVGFLLRTILDAAESQHCSKTTPVIDCAHTALIHMALCTYLPNFPQGSCCIFCPIWKL